MTTISAVVPMYNEEKTIEACLRALLDQTLPFDEIIVVDNRSTDSSAEIVQRIAADHPTVQLISEAEPGCYAARTAGYDAATSDIIARTDADTRPESSWAQAIVEFFDSEVGSEFSAVTGLTTLYDAPPFDFIDRRARTPAKAFRNGAEIGAIHGLNHAMRKSAWIKIRGSVTARQDVWEDMDMSMALLEKDLKIYFEPRLVVASSTRALRTFPLANTRYISGGIRTARARGDKKRTRMMYVDFPIRMVLFTIMWLIFRPWDEATQTWRLRRLVQPLRDPHLDVTKSR